MTTPPETEASALDAAQRWLYEAIVSPDEPAVPASVMLAGSGRLTVERCLAIYRNGYRRRLLDAMRHLYPALAALLGREVFEELAGGYLCDHPPRSYTLARLGDRFPAYLDEHRPDRDMPSEDRESWIDLMIDLARYESVFTALYHGPGIEGRPPAVPPSFDEEATVVAAPCLRTLRVSAPVHRLHADLTHGRRAALPPPEPASLVMFRRDYRVTATAVPPEVYTLLTALLHGLPVGRAAVETASFTAQDAWQYVRTWTALGWVEPSAAPSCARGRPPAASRGPAAASSRADEPVHRPTRPSSHLEIAS